jgi:transposase
LTLERQAECSTLSDSSFQAMKIAVYETCLTEAQWALLEPLLPKPSRRGRPPTDRRWILNAILYLTKVGCHWRLLPKNFPPWQTVYHVFRRWTLEGTWEAVNAALRSQVRRAADKGTRPTAAILDSQSVKSDPHGGTVGYDAAKKIKGRKRHVLVDTLGLLLGVRVTPASTPERAGAQTLLQGVRHTLAWLRLLWVDGGYSGADFAQGVQSLRPTLRVAVVKRSAEVRGFKILPRRWVVERTFSWFMRHRRLVRDYETTPASAQAFVYLAMIRVQLRRLA